MCQFSVMLGIISFHLGKHAPHVVVRVIAN